jgi:hypothetical protein
VKITALTNQNEGVNKTVGSNPTPSECYHYNELQKPEKSRVTSQQSKANYKLFNLNLRGGYDLTPDAYVWHPDPAVSRMWGQQIEARK